MMVHGGPWHKGKKTTKNLPCHFQCEFPTQPFRLQTHAGAAPTRPDLARSVVFAKLFQMNGFSEISQFLERISNEHIEQICSLEFKLCFISICSNRIRSRK